MSRKLLLGAIALLVPLLPTKAKANFSIAGYTGVSFLQGDHALGVKNTTWFLGTEATYRISIFGVGLFYDQNFLTQARTGKSGSHHFYGILGRAGLGPSGSIQMDAKVGLSQRSLAGVDSNPGLGYGFGLGYKIELSPSLSVGPRAGVRILNTALPEPEGSSGYMSGTMLDFGILFTFSL